MSRVVLDASVVVALYVDEQSSEDAHRAMVAAKNAKAELLAPELLIIEVANALWKAVSSDRLGHQDAVSALADLSRLEALSLQSISSLVADAFELALQHELTAYDATYAALARSVDGVLISGDRQLVECAQSIGIVALEPRSVTPSALG